MMCSRSDTTVKGGERRQLRMPSLRSKGRWWTRVSSDVLDP